ncbi:hypothetical protein PR001_g16013 [Phytophthora rubi]|uniref:START domain-containing protein n=1 Tax=Phytophthora rubi TaxID=129364 RepID=A0A6A3KNU5_9STRA|nr:hypothetical protein PR002_g15747 [Phytophthora rubi]KAE9011041.1 hypothetical protein PR001_g16013 [Phytophthora rubi]
MLQARPKFTDAELLELLAALDDTMDSSGTEQDVKMKEQSSAWNPSVNVVLDGALFTSEHELEKFVEALAPVDLAAAAGVHSTCESHVGAKRALLSMPMQRPKRYRKTRKQEIDHLRAVAAEMEKKLRELSQPHTQSNIGSDPFWKCVSNRLLKQRQKSAVENARLRGLVREQMTMLKALQRSLEKTPALSQRDVFPEAKERAVAPHQSKELYKDLFRNLSNLYSTGVDTMLPQSSTASPSLGGSKKVNIEIEADNNDGLRMCLQVVENKLVPFSFEKIRQRAWKILTGTNGHEDFELAVQNQGDEMFGWCKLDNAMGSMQMLGNIAVRQYVEANKLTIIWECEGAVHQGDSKTRIQPKGWCVFEPAEEDPTNATIFRRCAILSPIIPEDANLEESIGTTTELVLENYKRSVVYIFDGMLASLNTS